MADKKEVIEGERIYKALNEIMSACGLSGESGMEKLFHILSKAIQDIEDEWDDVVEESHKEGLCYNVNAWLANEIAKAIRDQKLENLG